VARARLSETPLTCAGVMRAMIQNHVKVAMTAFFQAQIAEVSS
jgi:hypothetical protein